MNTTKVNVHPVERVVSTILGGTLLLQSFNRLALGKKALAAALLYRGISGHSFLYQVIDVNTAVNHRSDIKKQHKNGSTDDGLLEIERSITIGKPGDELYHFWLEPQNLAQIMGGSIEVTQASGNRMHWALSAPLDRKIQWDSEIVEDRPGEFVRWKSLEGAQLSNEGSVYFRPAPRDLGTEVTLRFCFDVPGGALGNRVVKMLDIVPHMLAEKALRRFKSLVETGEIPTLKRNPAARKDAYVQAH